MKKITLLILFFTSLETSVAGKKLNTSYKYDDALNLSVLSYPDGSKADYSFNALGQITAISNGSTKYAENGIYDSLGRLLSLTAGNGKVTSRDWDASAGTLSGYSWGLDEYISRSLEWNNLGNITSISKGTTAKSYTNTYQYDRVGRLTYEHNGAEAEVSTKESQKENFLYVQNDVSGKKKGVHSSEVVKLDYYAGSAIVDLEAVQKISSLTLFGKNERIKPEHLEIWISEDGENWIQDKNVLWENDREGWKVVFKENTQTRYVKLHSLWDERDEDYLPEDHATYRGNLWNLFEVSYIADGKENTFSYDARGNRISEIETYTGSNGRVTDYEYYENSDLIKKAGKWHFNYDKNGNLIARGTVITSSTGTDFSTWVFSETEGELWTYEYDLQNRMTKTSYSGKGSVNLKERGSYVYDYRGLLVKKSYQNYTPSDLIEVENEEAAKAVTEFYEYTADGRVIYNEHSEDDNTTKTTYIWANTTLWCEINGGVVYYHHTDHLGTTEVVTDEKGTIVWEAGYEAFGSVLNESGESKFTPSYTGKFFDKASGLYYFNARWYDSELGKFTSSDKIRDGVNWWNYCNENPISFVDSDGLAGKFFGYFQRLLSFDNSSIGITPNNNNNINVKVPTPQSIIEDASLDFISNFDQDKALNTLQSGLDVAGVAFDPADALNGTISLARGNYVDAGLNFVSVVPLVGDAIGKGGKVGKKIMQHGDEVADVGKLLIKNSDEIASLTRDAIKTIPPQQGFDSFWKLKKALGSAGEGNHWHHIVEQSQIRKSGFLPNQIHNTNNIIAVDKATHAKITGYYKKIYGNTGLSLRDWLVGQPFEIQYQVGTDVLKMFGVIQ